MAVATLIHPRVLCYHRIGGPLELGVTRVGRSVFARQMTALAKAGWKTLTLHEYACRRADVPTCNQFLLTFDDGYESLAQHAYPVLAELGFTATTFLITDYVGKTNTWDVRYTWNRLRHLSWNEIERWQARGFNFASHGCTHRRLTWLDRAALDSELRGSRDLLVARLGPDAGKAIAYPFGAVSPLVQQAARAAGYELGFGGVRSDGAALNRPRIPVYSWDVLDVPFGLRDDLEGALGRILAHAANRCAVGTSVMNLVRGQRDAVSGTTVPRTAHHTPLTQRIARPQESAADV
ncbi:MAG TPA: polysaccharide deacetylase family protein [Gemmatimonadales bacterium]|nr:polysaccharide deacetylase family protein [Gemmatimonadales bacterium]